MEHVTQEKDFDYLQVLENKYKCSYWHPDITYRADTKDCPLCASIKSIMAYYWSDKRTEAKEKLFIPIEKIFKADEERRRRKHA